MKRLVIMAVLAVVLVVAFSLYTRWHNADLIALTAARREALRDLRPVLLHYREETGAFPKRLEELVPRYLKQIPPSLLSGDSKEPAFRIRYEAKCESARFIYHVIRGPDSTEVFDVGENRFVRNR